MTILRFNNIRVKYLDTQDIEELGFDEDILRSYGKLKRCFVKDNNVIELYPDQEVVIKKYKITETPHKGIKNIIEQITLGTKHLYRGRILNKSELKFILTRIGVL